MAEKIKIFISYAHKDADDWHRLADQFATLRRLAAVEVWDDREIVTGQPWKTEIRQALDTADIVVLLVSAAFIASDYCWHEEMERALERHRAGEIEIIPVLLKPCDIRGLPFEGFQGLPRPFEPIKTEQDRANVAMGLRDAVDRLTARKGQGNGDGPPVTRPKKVSIAKLPKVGPELFGRENELEILQSAWEDPVTNLVSIVAQGGVGKSALAWHWLHGLGPSYGNATHVFGWSFYSQGSSDQAQTSSDTFFDEVLAFFESSVQSGASGFRKAETLAQAVSCKRAILILDGVEPLQHGSGPLAGEFKDKAVVTLLHELAAQNRGLCIVTSRVFLSDLEHQKSNAPEIDLNTLSIETGAKLLISLGVIGEEKELMQAAREQNGHALAVTLLGLYLVESYEGDVRRRDRVTDLPLDGRAGEHARRIMAALAREFGEGTPEQAFLSLLGLFDRPVEGQLVDVLRTEPAIENLTGPLADLSEAGWNRTLTRLERLRLVFRTEGAFETHPLVREHFGMQFKENYRESWREAHSRLFNYLCGNSENKPDSIEDMIPLYRAVIHGCSAGRAREAKNQVYVPRIAQGPQFHSTKILGAYSSDLACLSHFFKSPWEKLVDGLTLADQAEILNWSAIRLRALGRLRESIRPLEAGLTLMKRLGQERVASTSHDTLCLIWLAVGEIGKALSEAEIAVELSDRCGDKSARVTSRTALAYSLFQSGKFGAASNRFMRAEAMYARWAPRRSFLYALQGFQYCEYLLEIGKAEEVFLRATVALDWLKKEKPGLLLEVALDTLSKAKACLSGAGGGLKSSSFLLDEAVDKLREAGQIQEIPRGLIARAEWGRITGDFASSERDLDESERQCRRSELNLLLADTLLERARLERDRGAVDELRVALDEAVKLVDECGYGRRKGAVAELRMALG